MTALVWFRSDLRVRDNPALRHARSAYTACIGVFAICARQWSAHDWGGPKVDFVLRNVGALSAELARLNIPLLIVRADWFSDLPERLLSTARRRRCDALVFNREHEVNELARDAAVTAAFTADGRGVCEFADQTILDVAALRTLTGAFYSVFTPFKRKWMDAYRAAPVSSLPAPKRQDVCPVPPDVIPENLAESARQSREDLWPAGERAAHCRLDVFIAKRIGDYARKRDFPGVAGTSTLSPYLACGVLSARQCLDVALAANNQRLDGGRKGVDTWINELIWREFYRHILIGFPRVCRSRPFRAETERIRWNADEEHFRAWCEGRTGFPIVDAGMRQLAQTGWMHNRVRMIVAMFLAKDLFIDWRWGERWFMQHLVDGDFASNNGGWQWSASTGTDAAPYFRIFNPASQSARFDPDGDYLRLFLPELRDLSGKQLHDPDAATRSRLGYPAPIIDRRASRRQVLAAFQSLSRTKTSTSP